MSEITIVTDSTADIPEELIKKYDIKVVPLYIHFEGKEYKDKVNITNREIYDLLEKGIEVKTSSPSPEDFIEIYKNLIERQNKKTVFSIHMSSKLSTTFDSARLARSTFPGSNIKIFDSRTVTMSLGLIVLEAARLASKGEEEDRIIKIVKRLIEENQFQATVDNFKYILRGGRVHGLKRLLNFVLKVRPIVTIKNGKIIVSKIVRTRKNSIEQMVKTFKNKFSNKGRVVVSVFYGDDLDAALHIKQLLEDDETLDIDEIILTEITPVIGTHSGPSAIGLAAIPRLS